MEEHGLTGTVVREPRRSGPGVRATQAPGVIELTVRLGGVCARLRLCEKRGRRGRAVHEGKGARDDSYPTCAGRGRYARARSQAASASGLLRVPFTSA